MKCAFCFDNPASNSEHLFPYSLGGGEDKLNCVCNSSCNQEFSALEIELVQKSPIAIDRAIAGLEGYKPERNKHRPGNLKFNQIVAYDSQTNIVSEAGIYKNGEHYIKAQTFIKDGTFYYDTTSSEEMEVLKKTIDSWGKNSMALNVTDDRQYKRIVFKKEENGSFSNHIHHKKDVHAIQLRIMRPDYEFLEHFTSRIFVETSTRPKLIVRAKSTEEGISFVKAFLEFLEQPKTIYLYGQHSNTVNMDIATTHDQGMVERCLVKIGLNFLLHHYPKTQHDPLLNNAISYIRTGEPNINTFEPDKIAGLDTHGRLIHYALIYQGTHGIIVTVSLFSSKIRFSFVIENLMIMAVGAHSKLEVDYMNRKNTIFSPSDQKIIVLGVILK